MKSKIIKIISLVLILVSVISLILIRTYIKKAGNYENAPTTTEIETEIQTTTKPETKEETTIETTEEIATTVEQKTTVKNNSSNDDSNSSNSSNKNQNSNNTTKQTTKVQTTKPVVTTEKTTTFDSYYDASKHSVGYVTFNNPRGTNEDSAYWTTCVNEFIWCEDSQGTCETCFIDREVYGFTGKGQWHCSDSLVISPSAENMQEIMSIAGRQRPNFDGEYEGQTHKIKFWVWDPC